jgi:hypothetical protein
MALWSPKSALLLYAREQSIWAYTNRMDSYWHPDVTWLHPSFSPDGRYVAYAERGFDGHARVRLMDVPTEKGVPGPVIGNGFRMKPFFLTDNLIWMTEEGPAGCQRFTQPATYIYDRKAGTESPSIIDNVFATWPATSALGS